MKSILQEPVFKPPLTPADEDLERTHPVDFWNPSNDLLLVTVVVINITRSSGKN
jgi:hypothetical protein